MNEAQASEIGEQLEMLSTQHEELRRRLELKDTSEELFVKSLEKVQGDERDTIVVSCTYGPSEPGGPVAMRFGPINQQGGHRRLNVLFTRAKRAIELVTSIESHQIQATATSSQGVHAFRNYLKFVENQSLETGRPSGREPDSPFEVVVAEAIQRHGYEVDCQVGVANYFIDLAIRHPEKPDTYLLGVECDGATYHSARAARDRDKYRQAVLEGLGWQIYRIWSTDWFENHEREIKKLKKHLENIQQNTIPQAQQRQKNQDRKEPRNKPENPIKPTLPLPKNASLRTSNESVDQKKQAPLIKVGTSGTLQISEASKQRPSSIHGEEGLTPARSLAVASNPKLEGFLGLESDKGFAVLDLETTGFGKSAEILEIAVIRLGRHGELIDIWETLIRPINPIKNSFIHGITDQLVSDAPSFGEIAIELSELLHGHVLVAHNLNSFDKPILAAHFEGTPEIRIDLGLGIDTMPKPKVKLAELCAIHGVKLKPEYAHSAMGDTRALAEVFQKGLAYLTKQTRAVQADPQMNSTPISTRKKVRIRNH